MIAQALKMYLENRLRTTLRAEVETEVGGHPEHDLANGINVKYEDKDYGAHRTLIDCILLN